MGGGWIAFEREAFASAPDQVIVVHLRVSVPGQLAFVARLSSPMEHHITFEDGEGLLLAGRGPVHVEPSYRSAPRPIVYQEGQGLPFACLFANPQRRTSSRRRRGGPARRRCDDRDVDRLGPNRLRWVPQRSPSSDEVTRRARADALAASKRGHTSRFVPITSPTIAAFSIAVAIDLGTTAAAELANRRAYRRFSSSPGPIPSCFRCSSNTVATCSSPALVQDRSPPTCKGSGTRRCAPRGARTSRSTSTPR